SSSGISLVSSRKQRKLSGNWGQPAEVGEIGDSLRACRREIPLWGDVCFFRVSQPESLIQSTCYCVKPAGGWFGTGTASVSCGWRRLVSTRIGRAANLGNGSDEDRGLL